MSIWGSVGDGAIGVDLHGPGADEYAGTGDRPVDIGFAHATGFGNPSGRLSLDADDNGLHACVMIDRDNLRRLISDATALLAVLDAPALLTVLDAPEAARRCANVGCRNPAPDGDWCSPGCMAEWTAQYPVGAP